MQPNDDFDEFVDDRSDEEGWCECGSYHTEEELASNQCDCCGGRIE